MPEPSNPNIDSPTFHFLSLHAEWLEQYFAFGTFKKAVAASAARIAVHQLRDYAIDKHGTVDGRPYGGGDGMVLRADVLYNATQDILSQNPGTEVWVTDPRAEPWTQSDAKDYWDADEPTSVLFVCGRFMGVDERYLKLQPHRKVSSGSYVLGGGELAALSICESVLRLGCKVIKQGNQTDSSDSSWRPEYYTRPESFEDLHVPEALLSGDPKQIKGFYDRSASLLEE